MQENGPMGRIPSGEYYKRSSVPRKVRRSIEEEDDSEDSELDEDEQTVKEEGASKRHRVVVARPDIVYHQPAEIVHRAPVVVHRPDLVIHRAPVVVHRPSVIVHKPDVVVHQPPVVFNTPNPVVHTPHAVSHDMYVTRPVPEFQGSQLNHVGGVTATPAILGHVENIGHSVSYGRNCNEGDDDCDNRQVFGEQEYDFPVRNGVGFGTGMGGFPGFNGFYHGGLAGGNVGQAAGFADGYLGQGGVADGGAGVGVAGFGRGDIADGQVGGDEGLAAGQEGFAGDAAVDGDHDLRENVPEGGESEAETNNEAAENAETKSTVQKPHKKSLKKNKEKHAKATKKQILGGGHVGVGLGGVGKFSIYQ